MFETYNKDVEFFVVYIREAHAIDSRLPMEFGMIEDPVTGLERMAVASQCMADLDLPIPAIVDQMDDAVNLAYRAWPDRLYLVGKDGKIAYSGGPGPFMFLPEELNTAIEKELGISGR
jgi:type I thyroxine 5'-deiodinase